MYMYSLQYYRNRRAKGILYRIYFMIVFLFYSISSNPNTLERETNLAGENGDLRVAMTPRRVKRRSYRYQIMGNLRMFKLVGANI